MLILFLAGVVALFYLMCFWLAKTVEKNVKLRLQMNEVEAESNWRKKRIDSLVETVDQQNTLLKKYASSRQQPTSLNPRKQRLIQPGPISRYQFTTDQTMPIGIM